MARKSNVAEILAVNFNPGDYILLAEKLIHSTGFLQISKSIENLIKIIEQNRNKEFTLDTVNIKNILIKFHNWVKNGGEPSRLFTIREVKSLIYSIDEKNINNQSIYNEFVLLNNLVFLINSKWQDSFLLPLFSIVLRKWENLVKNQSFEIVYTLFHERLSMYCGMRTSIKNIYSNKQYFNKKNGDVLLGSEIALKKISLKEVAKYLSIPNSWLSFFYFSRVVDAYFEKSELNLELINELDEFFTVHQHLQSKKRTISKIILRSDEVNIVKTKELGFKFIGDPENAILWSSFQGATEIETDNIKKARNKLNEWIKNQFITVFFEKCINDKRRRNYWLNMTKHISQFRVVGGNTVKRILMKDDRICEYLDSRLILTKSSSINAAIIMKIKNKIIVEFSDIGAYYVYNESNPFCPRFSDMIIYDVNELKKPYLPQLFRRKEYTLYNIQSEGQKSHFDGYLTWEESLTGWFKYEMKLDV